MIKQKVLQLIEEQFGKETGTVTLSDHLVNTLGGDSVDVLEVSMLLESEFKIKISSDESNLALSVQELINLVEAKCQLK